MKLPTLFVGLAALWCRATDQKSYRPGGQSSGSFGSASSSVGGGSSGGGSSSSGFSSGGSSASGFGGGSFGGGSSGGSSFGAGGGGSGGGSGSIEDAVPGVPGDDYPIFAEVPPTSFLCDGQVEGGYYADVDTDCQAFHICAADAEGGLTKYSFLCPNGTLFNQQYFICDWWFNVDCSLAEQLYSRNNEVAAERQQYTSASAAGGSAGNAGRGQGSNRGQGAGAGGSGAYRGASGGSGSVRGGASSSSRVSGGGSRGSGSSFASSNR